MKPVRKRSGREPTIALINIVFLLLVFFIVAGTLAPPLESKLHLVKTDALEGAPPPDALVLYPDGKIRWRGEEADPAAHVAGLPEAERAVLRIVPDRDARAEDLVALGRALLAAGAGRVVIVTERGLQ